MPRYAKLLTTLGAVAIVLLTAGWLLASQPQLLQTGGEVRVVGCDGDSSEPCQKLFCKRALFLDARLGGAARIGHVDFTHYNDALPGLVSYMGTAHLIGAPPIDVACTLQGTEVVSTVVGRSELPSARP